MDVRQYADLFLSESRDHLTSYNHLLLEWEKDPAAREAVGGIFRAVHTIKGMAATMGYSAVAELSHRIESLLDLVRREEREVTPPVFEALFAAGDALEKTIADAVAGREAMPQELLERLEQLTGGAEKTGQKDGADETAREKRRASRPSMPVPALEAGRQVRVQIRSEASLKGARALLVLKRAEKLGKVSAVTPAAAAFEADDFDGMLAFRLDAAADAAAIEKELRLAGDVDAVDIQSDEPAEQPQLEAAARGKHIRVDLRRLDTLMDNIGELAIARGRLATLAARQGDPSLDEIALQISRLTSGLQSEIIAARMTPVWQVFDRFPRMVRDLARQTGKQVEFRVEGKDIELDRAILDEIADPLVHLLRNAIDHGIEPPETRVANGKKPQGLLTLAAVRERSSVAIRVADDGRGVDRARVIAKAKELGLLDPGVQAVAEEDLYRLLMRSGFSTAKEVTDVSGRGVGIDVVATAARALGGSLEIRSEEGKGTAFTLRLPVTLAVMRALLARVGDETYAVPLTHVAETVDPREGEVQTVQGREALVLRGRLLPLVRLTSLLGTTSTAARPLRVPVIVLEMGERRTGVMVDQLVGQQEIVVKGFEAPKGTLPVFSGATILGDGKPALILDAGGLM